METLLPEEIKIDKRFTKKIPFIDLTRQYLDHKNEILAVVDNVLSSGSYILGEYVETFEKNVAAYLGCKFVVGVANGLDALILGLKSLNVGAGDEVIVPVNSFIASAGAVIAAGAKPVFCDVAVDLNIDISKIEPLINKKTKAMMPVHLTGRPAAMNEIMQIAKKYNLFVIEDAAQAIGASYFSKKAGNLGHIGCFSLHPLKNLHVYGDGGLISTNDEEIYKKIKLLRNHGLANRDTCVMWGFNSRLDAIQAAIANFGLAHLNRWNDLRRRRAKQYQENLCNFVKTPIDKPHEQAVYHNFVILSERRDELSAFLSERGIETKIHYPIPLHLQPASRSLGYSENNFPVSEKIAKQMLSLPIYSELHDAEVHHVIDEILFFYQKK